MACILRKSEPATPFAATQLRVGDGQAKANSSSTEVYAVMAYTFMAYTFMAYIVMAYIGEGR